MSTETCERCARPRPHNTFWFGTICPGCITVAEDLDITAEYLAESSEFLPREHVEAELDRLLEADRWAIECGAA